MAAATSIYLSPRGALAVRVEGSAKKPKITRAAELEWELPQPGEDGLAVSADDIFDSKAAQLKTWLKKSKLSGGPIVLCVDSSHVILRELRVAFTERRQIDKVIAFQVEGVIPSTAIEDLAVGYSMLEKDSEGSRLLVSAAHRSALREQLDLLEDIGIEPEAADSTISGAINLRALSPALANVAKPTLWIDVQGDHAVVAVLEGTQLLSIRSVRIPRAAAIELEAGVVADADASGVGGSHDDDIEMGDDDEVAIVEGDIGESLYGSSPTPAPLAAPNPNARISSTTSSMRGPAPAGEALVRLLSIEARRSILGAQANSAIERVVVTGVPDSMRASIAPMRRELGVTDFEVINLLDPMLAKDKSNRVKIKLPQSLMLATAAGVGTKLLGNDASGVNFLTGNLSPTDAFDQVKNPLAFAATLLFMVSGIMLMLVLSENRAIQGSANRTLAEFDIDKSLQVAYENAPEARRKNLASLTIDFESATKSHELLTAEVASIKAGNKKIFPPLWEADIAIDRVLRTVNESIGEVMPDGKKNLVHFWMKSITFSQDPGRGTGGTTGKIDFQCYLEEEPEAKRFLLRDALQALMVKNPNFDGVLDKRHEINLISDIQMIPDQSKRVQRGERRVKGERRPIIVRLYTFSCTLTELKKATPAAGTTGATRRR